MFNRKLKERIVYLEKRLDELHDLNNHKSFTIEKMKREAAQMETDLDSFRKQREPVTVKRMVGLKFRALFNGLYQPTEFKTGPGPCGKTVTHFTTSRTERELTIHQHHTDGSQKDFEYRLSDIDGRIQYDYEQVKVYGEEAERERAFQAFVRVRPRVVI